MQLNFIAFAVPLFLFFMGMEYFMARRQKKSIHRFNESIANLNVGIAERLTDLLTTGSFFFLYSWLNTHFSFFKIQATPLTWFLLFLATDLVWYWYHRLAHEVNLFWGVHVVHHQSEDFNYTVSGRITLLQALVRGSFWAILPIIGFPAHMIAILLLIHGAYPFFTHTQMIGKLGWLEYVFVTPSHHRVHHSCNPQYLDKNYGDVLIIWDKLFGTFKKEEETPEYGLTKPLGSYSFLWQHFHFLLELGVAFKRAKSIRQKLKVLFGRPDDIDPRIRASLERKLSFRNQQQTLNRNLRRFIRVQTLLTLAMLFLVILFSHYLLPRQLVFFALFILLSLVNTGAMLEQRSWVFSIDYVRLGLLGIIIHSFYPGIMFTTLFCMGMLMILVFYKTLNTYYSRVFYNYS